MKVMEIGLHPTKNSTNAPTFALQYHVKISL